MRSNKKKTTALILCVFGGWFGVHQYYVGKIGKGILYTFTMGLFFIGWALDILKILTNNFYDSKGMLLGNDMSINSLFSVLNIDNSTLFQPKKYDMDTLSGINSIPVPAQNYNTGEPTKDCIYYVLQRKATEHKRNGKLDLAIACLRKSNELSDYEQRPLLLEKDYLRLVNYIKLTGDLELAQYEQDKIYQRHPEFLDKRISNLVGIKETLKKNREWNNDYVLVSTNNTCPICKKYDLKIYSISGRTNKYPKLPHEIIINGGFCPNCYLGLNTHFDGISS